LWRAAAFRDVRHIQLLLINLAVQVLAALFIDAKAPNLLSGIVGKALQFGAVDTAAG